MSLNSDLLVDFNASRDNRLMKRPSHPAAQDIADDAKAAPASAANFIRALRKARVPKMTLEQLGELCGTTPQTIRAWEMKGNLQVNDLPKVAQALAVEPADLVPGGWKLTTDERQLLLGYRRASEKERRSISRLMADLVEPEDLGLDDKKVRPARRRD